MHRKSTERQAQPTSRQLDVEAQTLCGAGCWTTRVAWCSTRPGKLLTRPASVCDPGMHSQPGGAGDS
eukprot:13357740-Alexandrium_andersonii.AAC.1